MRGHKKHVRFLDNYIEIMNNIELRKVLGAPIDDLENQINVYNVIFSTLSQAEKEIIKYRVNGISVKDIAIMLNIDRATVYKRIERMSAKINKLLEDNVVAL